MVQGFSGCKYYYLGQPTETILRSLGSEENPLQILSEYEHIKWNVGESVQDYCIRFNSIYNAIPDHLRPPMGLAMMNFLDGFDANKAYQLRERESATMEDMQKIAVSVEENLLAKRARARAEKKVTRKE